MVFIFKIYIFKVVLEWRSISIGIECIENNLSVLRAHRVVVGFVIPEWFTMKPTAL